MKQHSLLTAMSQQDGIPMLIYEEPEKHVMWSAFMTTDRSTKEDNWYVKPVLLFPLSGGLGTIPCSRDINLVPERFQIP